MLLYLKPTFAFWEKSIMQMYLLEIGDFKLPSYGFFIAVGLVLCVLTLYYLIKKANMPEAIFDAYFTAAIIGIVLGFVFAVLFQAFYTYLDTGVFRFEGLTVMGGLIGGATAFIGYVFLFMKNKKTQQAFWDIADFAAACICLAHCFGRIGCFMAGCCYGKEEDGFLSVILNYGAGAGVPRLPTQLFEALFLFLMFLIFMLYNSKKTKRGYGIGIYAISYGVWRFFIEFLRDDYRGGVDGAIFSPSQIQSFIFIAVGIAVIVLVYFLNKKGIIQDKMDWSEELKIEADAREELRLQKQKEKEEKAKAISYEEYAQAVEDAKIDDDIEDK